MNRSISTKSESTLDPVSEYLIRSFSLSVDLLTNFIQNLFTIVPCM